MNLHEFEYIERLLRKLLQNFGRKFLKLRFLIFEIFCPIKIRFQAKFNVHFYVLTTA